MPPQAIALAAFFYVFNPFPSDDRLKFYKER